MAVAKRNGQTRLGVDARTAANALQTEIDQLHAIQRKAAWLRTKKLQQQEMYTKIAEIEAKVIQDGDDLSQQTRTWESLFKHIEM